MLGENSATQTEDNNGAANSKKSRARTPFFDVIGNANDVLNKKEWKFWE